MQNSRGLSPGTGNSSEDNIGDWSELKKTERPVTVIGARRSARTAAEVEMSFMIAGASGLLWQTAGGDMTIMREVSGLKTLRIRRLLVFLE